MEAPSAKRAKVLRTLGSFFAKTVEGRRLVCKGNIHQGNIESGGSQCICVAISFLCKDNFHQSPSDVDALLHTGTELFNRISSHRSGMTVHELNSSVDIFNKTFDLSFFGPRSGLVSQQSDDTESLSFCVKSALNGCIEEATTCLLTLGNSPGASIAIKHVNNSFIVFDSHSRDDNDTCSPDGKAVVLQINSINDISKYIEDISRSISVDHNLPFEATAVTITERLEDDESTGTYDSAMDPASIHSPEPLFGYQSQSTSVPTSETTLVRTPETTPVQTSETRPVFTSGASPTNTSESASDTMSSSYPQSVASANVDDQSCCGDDDSAAKDIAQFTNRSVPDSIKHFFIENRQPNVSFKFPAKIYKDKRKKDGQMKRYCCREWFDKFDFICYSESVDGLFCLACLFFPNTAHRRPKMLVKGPYRNWKDAVADLKSHTGNEYHINSMSKLNAFKTTFRNPSTRIDVTLDGSNTEGINKNREILKAILKCIEFCGRQGISLRGHRDDDTSTSLNKGNFKALIDFRAEAGDTSLKEHLESCARNASYTSKHTQNDLQACVKQFIQNCIVNEVNQQPIGPYFGYQCDEVTDSSNWEQLGIVLRYTVDNKPVERLIEFVQCDQITGEAICNNIVKSLTEAGLDIQFCRSQTMDGAGNMSGKQAGCAARFKLLSPKENYHYCSSHDLNLALCKCCGVKEVQVMLDALKQLGLFFKYSPKRSRRLEEAISEANSKLPKSEQIPKSKFHVFCETRWVEKHTTLFDFNKMYEPILECLEAIGQLETGWDTKAVTDAYGLLNKITESSFIMCFQTVLHMFGYVTGLCSKLQGSSLDILEAYDMVTTVKTSVSASRNEDNSIVFEKATKMAQKAGLEHLEMPRRCGRQTQRNNVPADSTEQYFERVIFYPFVDSLISQLNMRFNTMTRQACLALCLLPSNIDKLNGEAVQSLYDHYSDDMPQADTFQQELQLWKRKWGNSPEKPNSITDTLSETCKLMFPNIFTILLLQSLTSVTSASVERSNSSLKFIKNSHRSTMGEDRFNALMLLYIHRDIKLDLDEIINVYARKYPRRMLLLDPF